MTRIKGIYYRFYLIHKRRFFRTLLSIILSPLLYLIAFGWGLGENLNVEGVAYPTFMLPGLIALSGMHMSYGISSEINITRFLNKVFEENLLSGASAWELVTGYVLFGMTKALVSFAFIITTGIVLNIIPATPMIIIPVLLNAFMFSSLGVFIALTINSHRDMNNFTTFVITPMSFLAGTFFSLQKLPTVLRALANIIPLTHSSLSIRRAFIGQTIDPGNYIFLISYSALFFGLAVYTIFKTRN